MKNLVDKQRNSASSVTSEPDAQTKVLSHGLGYAVSPDSVNDSLIVYMVSCERACWKLPKSEAEQLRSEIVWTQKSAKPPPSNISKDERQANKQLQREASILVLGADKGRATVAMENLIMIIEIIYAILSDTKTNEKLEKDPAPRYKKQLFNILQNWRKEEKSGMKIRNFFTLPLKAVQKFTKMAFRRVP